jgi:asparagine N-glycosylation enzyme membrane subunit Stt3
VPEQNRGDASLPTIVSDLWELIRTYVKQETVGPLKGIARSVALGVGGSVVLSVGLVLLALAGLRALQTETGTTFDGSLSWAPYLLTLIGVVVVIGLALAATRKRSTSARRAHR